ncbi:hypothetical protein [Phenylobacterium sp.]|uniref:hypothetical protein n=1 Tax=Phenylobacterium sp. TaxID=1871053 RepID=UPI0025D225D9|nr:hypothetical protein [Phenylobacterium sp.]
MRKVILAAGMLACLSLAACDSKPAAPAADATAAAPRKSQAREAPLYAGQEQVQSVQSGAVTAAPGGGVNLTASATAAGPGYTQAGFLPRIYAGSPPDGIYEIDVVAQKPAAAGAATPTPIEVKGDWAKYTDGRVKGVKFISKTNDVVAMLGK